MATAAERIRLARTRKGMTLEELGNAIHVSRQAIHKYEQGVVTAIPLTNIMDMAKVLDCEPAWLAGFIDEEHWPPEDSKIMPIYEKASDIQKKEIERFAKFITGEDEKK